MTDAGGLMVNAGRVGTIDAGGCSVGLSSTVLSLVTLPSWVCLNPSLPFAIRITCSLVPLMGGWTMTPARRRRRRSIAQVQVISSLVR